MGNLESNLTPYYEIVNEETNKNKASSKSSPSQDLTQINPNNLSIWSIKRANVNNTQTKNAILFELVQNTSNNNNKQNLKFALNQIRILKTVRHPNIVKYLYSEEPTAHHLNKCILITESIRPIACLIDNLNREQIIRGLYSITNSLQFLHEKLKISHNNINKSCIYLNSKQTWKLSDFELALNFNDLNKTNLSLIYNYKCKNSITPEEEACFSSNNSSDANLFDSNLKQFPHSIDSYGWSLLMIDLLFNREANNISNNHYKSKLFKTNSTMNMIDDEEEYEDDELNENDYKDIESYLSKDVKNRPGLGEALNLKLFDLYRDLKSNNSSNLSEPNEFQIINVENNTNTNNLFDPFKLTNLDDLEADFDKLNYYLIDKYNNSSNNSQVKLNEKLIDLLLSPFMFFSKKVTQQIFPCILIPKEELDSKNSTQMIYYHNFLNNPELVSNDTKNNSKLKPFIDLDKYKAIVLPRILSLFSMRSIQIRIVLLEYFPFYIHLINDNDTLRYEILPELLVSLKELNDQLVSLTFSCLSLMVKLLGSEIVVGKSDPNSNSQNLKYFSDNIPKTVYHEAVTTKPANINNNNVISSNSLFGKQISKISTKLSLTASLYDEDNYLGHKNGGDDESSASLSKNKVFSDSMIGLHDDETISTSSSSSSTSTSVKLDDINNKVEPIFDIMYSNGDKYNNNNNNTNKNNKNELVTDEWSNDFGWSSSDSQSNLEAIKSRHNQNQATSASLFSLNGSSSQLLDSSGLTKNNHSSSKKNFQTTSFIDNNFDSYDIKNINIKKSIIKNKSDTYSKSTTGDEFIDSFLNDTQPSILNYDNKGNTIKKQEFEMSKLNNASTKSLSSNLSYNPSNSNLQNGNLDNNGISGAGQNLWECEEEPINLD